MSFQSDEGNQNNTQYMLIKVCVKKIMKSCNQVLLIVILHSACFIFFSLHAKIDRLREMFFSFTLQNNILKVIRITNKYVNIPS